MSKPTSYDHRYLYQGPAEWLLGATMVVDEYSNLYDQQLFAWGVELSGSEQGAWGIDGLIMIQDTDGGGSGAMWPRLPLSTSRSVARR